MGADARKTARDDVGGRRRAGAIGVEDFGDRLGQNALHEDAKGAQTR